MKKLFLAALMLPIITLTACSSDDDENNHQQDAGEKYLSEISIKEHEYNFGEPSEYGEDYEDYIFDKRGNLIKKSTNYYNATVGRIPNDYEYVYDENNRMTESSYYMITLQERCFYEYNDIDSVSKMTVYDGDGDLDETWTYEYGTDRRLTKSICVNSFWTETNNYTYSGNTVTCVTYHDGELFGTMIDEYDTYGNLLTNTWINGDTGKETLQKSNTYEYDTNGRLKKASLTNVLYGTTKYKEYTYNEDGTINKIHVTNSYNNKESDLIYEYIYK